MPEKIKICRILKLRDDTDIIRNNLIYYYNIGIKDQFIMLHLPTDELMGIINNVQKELPDLNLRLLYWNKEGKGLSHINADYLKVLTDAAQSEGFKWIVGSDSDEFLILKQHKTIQDLIKEYDDSEIISLIFEWVNYYLTNIISEQKHFYDTMTRRRPETMSWTKSIGKFNKSMYFVQGLHHVADMLYGQRSKNLHQIKISEDIAFYAHFPYRSKKQYVEKNKIQAHKFGGWRKEKLNEDSLYFEKQFDSTIMSNKWPITLDSNIENIKINTNFIESKIPNTHLMELQI